MVDSTGGACLDAEGAGHGGGQLLRRELEHIGLRNQKRHTHVYLRLGPRVYLSLPKTRYSYNNISWSFH